jgi:hypothetical protein
MNAWWKSPRGFASLGDDPSPCWGLCSRSMMQSGSKQEKRIGGLLRCISISPLASTSWSAAMNGKAYRLKQASS